jgi:hypothetical protein
MGFSTLFLGLALSAGQSPAEKLVDFPALGKAFIAEHCGAKATQPCSLDEVLAEGFVRLPVGPFDLEIPHEMLGDKQGLDNLRNITLALSRAVIEWTQWQGAEKQVSQDMTQLIPRWAAQWKPTKSFAIKKANSRDFTDVMGLDDEQRALLKQLEDLCDDPANLALVIPQGRQLRLILAPTRLGFMQWNGYAGLADESLRAVIWFDDASQWTQFWLGWDLVIALEYASWNGFDPTFKASQPMKKVGDGIMAQHVVQQATFGLLRSCRPSAPEARYETALAMLMAIEACGEVNTIDGAGGVSTSGAKTRPYSKFVPGGNPKGGTLPGRSSAALSTIVECRWRKGHGADGFAGPLKQGQTEGGKAAKSEKGADVLANFVLKQEDNSGKHLVHAPFFGPHADAQEYPPLEYLVDYAEFYRAYKTGFFYWIEKHGIDEKNPGEKWTELVRGLSKINEQFNFDQLVEEVYGLPISAENGASDSLEWRFLRWLSKAKV